MKNTSTIEKLKEAIEEYPDHFLVIGNTVDKFGNWYTYPAYVDKVPGDNHMVCIQLRPFNNKAEKTNTVKSEQIELLEKYSMWLTKNGYMDTDWKDEEPFAIDEFLKTLK